MNCYLYVGPHLDNIRNIICFAPNADDAALLVNEELIERNDRIRITPDQMREISNASPRAIIIEH